MAKQTILLFLVLHLCGLASVAETLQFSALETSAVVEKEVVILDAEARPSGTHRYTLQELEGNSEGKGTLISFGTAQQQSGAANSAGSAKSVGLFTRDEHLHYAELVGNTLRLSGATAEGVDHGGCASPLRSELAQQSFERTRAARQTPTVLHSNSAVREIQLLAVAPGDFVGTRSAQEAIDEVIFAVEGANVYYRQLGLRIVLKAIQVIPPGPEDPYAFASESQSAITMLDRLRAQWLFRESPSRDVTVVFAASSFRQIFGLAYPAVSCVFPEFSYGFVSKGGAVGAQSQTSLAATLAHEIGHLIGMSHDSTLTAVGPTVMWPTFATTPAGFSETSRNEFFVHEKNGGASCFTEKEALLGTAPTAILPGTVQRYTVTEGETLELQFTDPTQAFVTYYVVQNLPIGAVFDPSSGLFRYTPSRTVVEMAGGSREQRFSIQPLGSQSQPMEVVLQIVDANVAPRITFSTTEELAAAVGATVQVSITAEELDGPQDFARLSLENAAQARAYAGRPAVAIHGAVASLMWQPSLPGSYEFTFSATDIAGARSRRTLIINVAAQNLSPQLEVPGSVALQGTQTTFTVNAFDPENQPIQLSVSGLPPGVFIERTANSWTVNFSNSSVRKKEVALRFSVTDGNSSTEQSVVVAVDEVAELQTAAWPGTARATADGLAKSLLYYHGSTGTWQQRSCSGELAEEFQFGGLVGDMPLVFEERGVRYAALYRVVQGSGVFIVKHKEGLSFHPWGAAGDIPLLADFDGDAVSDYAVYRPTTGEWIISFSLLAPQQLTDMSHWTGARTPFAEDVDADGLADRILVLRGADGEVFADVRLATGRQLVIGIADVGVAVGAEPIVGDVDNDGRADLLVRSSTGALMGIRSSSSTSFVDANFAPGGRVVHTDCSFGERGRLQTMSRYRLLSNSQVPTFFPDAAAAVGELLELYQLRQRSGAQQLPSTDVDGDGRSDLTLWRPQPLRGIGSWFSRQSASIFEFTGSTSYQSPWLYGDRVQPVPFSFEEARGETLVHFEDGTWRFFGPKTPEQEIRWGQPGDVALSGDYNGDSFTDLTVYRPAEGTWWTTFGPSFRRAVKQAFGGEGDIPVPADFDGDGSVELAIYRPATGSWAIRYPDGEATIFAFGLPGDVPMPADYLGEGRAQIAVWRPSSGLWVVLRNEQEVVVRQWGLPGDLPVSLDRDGDGRAELGVWRPSDGTWYSRSIQDADDLVYVTQYGLPGDLPMGVPNRSHADAAPEIVQ